MEPDKKRKCIYQIWRNPILHGKTTRSCVLHKNHRENIKRTKFGI